MKYSSIVEAIFRHSQETPEKLCIADRSSGYSYQAFYELIRRFAAYYRASGVTKGDKVIVEAGQTAAFAAAGFGLHLAGAVFVPLENGCGQEKLLSTAAVCGASMTLYNRDLEEICSRLPSVSSVPAEEELPEAEALSEILFSTGTTGKEKGIMLSHRNDVAVAENIVAGSDMASDNVELIPSPLNHSHGLRSFYANMLCGGSVVLQDGLMDLKGLFSAMDIYGVNSMDLVPAALSILLRFAGKKLAGYRDRLRYIEFGSAAMSPEDRAKIVSLLPGVPLLNYYGSTESGRTTVFNFNAGTDKPGCIGKPTLNTDLIIVDDNRVPIVSSPERTGILACAGPMNMIGYYNDEEETRKATDGIYVYSSDEAYIDGSGDIILIGRKGDIINVGGRKVSPEEIENAARSHPCVQDCGCKGVPDPVTGQAPVLFIQLNPGCRLDAREMASFLAQHLEPFKIPKRIESTDRIPRTYNGKLLRRKLPD